MYVIHEQLRKKPKCRVELHIHLDGSIRHETIWELLRQKNLPLPGSGSLEDLKQSLLIQEPKDLDHFLSGFTIFMPALIDDLDAIERISYEFVEDQARQSVAYCEARLCPQLLVSKCLNDAKANGRLLECNEEVLRECNEETQDKEQEDVVTEATTDSAAADEAAVSIESVLEACLQGLKRGEDEFGTKVRLILCLLRGKSDWFWELLRLCEEYRDKGVVGIDIAGSINAGSGACEANNTDAVTVLDAAKERGIHITVHAGEDGGADQVLTALRLLHAERIGHGYRVIEDEEIYKVCLEEGVHFEMCPHSSYYTGAIKGLQLESKRHPILRLAEDGASFSINSDDPTVTGTRIGDEYKLLQEWGFTEAHFARANFEAAQRSFLPPEEKEELLAQLRSAYGVIAYCPPPLPATPSLHTATPSPSPSPTPPVPKNVTPPSGVTKPAVKIASWEDRS